MITAPFNFVPLSEKVFFPDWADRVSHDIPFSDGESGEIEITITAKSPIFIRDHKKKEEFCHHRYPDGKKEYYIPATSIKGMVRNVLEIMSFSKMSFVDDDTYAVRDLNNKELYRDKFTAKQIYGGWLCKIGDRYIIEDCGKPARISHQEIDKLLDNRFSNYFSDNFSGREDEKIAIYKYNLANWNLKHKFKYKKKNNQQQEVYVAFESNGDDSKIKEGTLVFTGQPTKRENTGAMGDGKGFEFIFFAVKDIHPLHQDIFEKFKFAYFDERNTQPKESKDWKYWKNELENGKRVPIFFRKKQNGEIESIGLSYLYKLPYSHSIYDGLPKNHINIAPTIDLPQAIFGFINDNDSLKGRVFISHFKPIFQPTQMSEKTLILGTPRPSYYPIYIEQQINSNSYKTYMDKNFKIKGWKRYPIHKNLPSHQNETHSKVTTTFKPLKQGVEFKGKLKYHNLKPQEIGALLSAITFHNSSDFYHSLGLAKAYGYGKVQLSITDGYSIDNQNKKKSFKDKDNILFYLEKFECMMQSFVNNWHISEQLIELFTMAHEQDNKDNSNLKYLDLTEFANKKNIDYQIKEKNILQLYSKLNKIKKYNPKSLILELDKCQKLNFQKKINHQELDLEYVKKNYKNKRYIVGLFFKKYPNLKNKVNDLETTVKENIDKETLFFHSAKLDKSIVALEKFKKNFPKSEYLQEIDSLIETLKEEIKQKELEKQIKQEWEEIKGSNDKNILTNFINKYSNHNYTQEAKNILNSIQAQEEKEKREKQKQEEAKRKAQNTRGDISKIIMDLNKKKKKRKK